MTETPLQWETARLVLTGTSLVVAGLAILATRALERQLGVPARGRVVLAAALVVAWYWSLSKHPGLVDALAVGSAALVVVLPVAVLVRVYAAMVGR